MPRAALALATLLCLAGCEEWHLSINRDGLVLVSVIGDGADGGGGYRLRTRDADGITRILEVPASGQLTLTPVADGELEVALLASESCRVSGRNPQTVTVSGGEDVRLAFDVRCS